MMHRKLLTIGVLAVFWVLWIVPAGSHPHVFVVQRLEAVFDDKGLAGIRVRWKFDDMFANMIAEDHDRNHNGQLEPSEVRSIRENAFDHIAEFNYFVFVKIDGQAFQVKYTTDFTALLDDRRLVYEFFVPCHVSATRNVKKIKVATYDPSYFTAIFFAKNSPLSLTCLLYTSDAADDWYTGGSTVVAGG